MGVVTRPGPTVCDWAASDASKTEASNVGRKRRHHTLGDVKLDRASERRSCRPRLIAWRGMLAPFHVALLRLGRECGHCHLPAT
jgi:hypothetical protein